MAETKLNRYLPDEYPNEQKYNEDNQKIEDDAMWAETYDPEKKGYVEYAEKLKNEVSINGAAFDGSESVQVNPQSVSFGSASAIESGKEWYKLGEVTLSNANQSRSLALYIMQQYVTESTNIVGGGILNAYVRLSGDGITLHSAHLTWSVKPENKYFNAANFRLYTFQAGQSVRAELWAKVDVNFTLYTASTLLEGGRYNGQTYSWELCDARVPSAAPAGTSYVSSTKL